MTVDRQKVKKYFNSTNKNSYYLLLGGLVGLFFFSSVSILAIASLIAAGIGGWQVYDTIFTKPTDEQMDAWLTEDLNLPADAASTALAPLDILNHDRTTSTDLGAYQFVP